MANTTRLVKVFIADTEERIPLEQRILYIGNEKVTDSTDQELFYEIAIKEILDKHNATRSKILDRKAQEKFGRDIFLEPAKIRDLKMVVVTLAEFK